MEKLTPREIAYDTAITALYSRFNNLASKTHEEKRIRNATARLHNSLLDKSGMDGLHLPYTPI